MGLTEASAFIRAMMYGVTDKSGDRTFAIAKNRRDAFTGIVEYLFPKSTLVEKDEALYVFAVIHKADNFCKPSLNPH